MITDSIREIKLNLHFLIRGAALVFCAGLLFSPMSTGGQTKPQLTDDLSQPIFKDSTVKYSDLIALVFSETGENTRKSVPLNNIFGDYQAKIYQGNLRIDYVRSVWVKYQGRHHLLLLINVADGDIDDDEPLLWQEMNVVALFDVKGEPRLIDAVDVQGDRLAFFSEAQPILRINSQTDAFLIANHHFNAGESFMNLTLLGVVKDRLKIILGDIPTLKTEEACGLNYEEKALLKLVPTSGKNYRNIQVDLKYIRYPDGEECERRVRGFTKNSRRRYAWDERRGEYVKIKGRK